MSVTSANRLLRLAAMVAFGALLVLLAANFYRYLTYVALLVPYPYGLDYGEGIIAEQARLMFGPRMYGDITVYPYIVFHYPPFYHLVARIAAAPGFDLLTSGRIVSVVAGLGAAGMLGVLAWLGAPAAARPIERGMAAGVAALSVFVLAPFVEWSPLMRVDMVATLLAFLGVLLGVLSVRRPWLMFAAVVVFTASVYSKQTCLSAPLATFAVLLLHDRRHALQAMAFGLVLALTLLAGMMVWTGGNFLHHILLYNVNRYSIDQVVELVGQQRVLLPFLLVGLTGFVVALRSTLAGVGRGRIAVLARVGDGGAGTVAAMVVAQFVAAGLMVLTIGKKGAAVNYFIESMCLWSLFAGLLASRALVAARGGRPMPVRIAAALILPVVMAAQVMLYGLPSTRWVTNPQARAEMDELARMVRAATKPVLSDDMVLLTHAGQEIALEPIIFADLAIKGLWDERLLVDMISRRALAFIVTDDGGPDGQLYRDRYNAAVRAAIAEGYPQTRRLGRYTVRSP